LNPLKKLAGQTAVYGLPSIIGRLLNYLLVPLYTRVFSEAEYGTVSVMYAYVGFFIVILTYGMETALFRYIEQTGERKKTYHTALLSVLVSSTLFILFTQIFSGNIASWIDYPSFSEYVRWFGMIIALDALVSIPLANLRSENRAKRFAFIRMLGIGVNIGLNLFFIILCPWILKTSDDGILRSFIELFFVRDDLIAWVFISNLLASLVTFLVLIPDMFGSRLTFNPKLWRKMVAYGVPLLIAGLAGIANETLDRIILRYLLPQNIAEAQVGIYSACYKISILMTIFIQAYRYAAEPFFFTYAKKNDSKNVYALLMNYFIIAVALLFLITMLYQDVVLLMIDEKFRVGRDVIPILLIANLSLGIYYNLSIWYKLNNMTRFGAMLSIMGALITIGLNFWLIPQIGYLGSAWATLICYVAMVVVSYFLGQRYFPVKYNLRKAGLYIGVAIFIVLICGVFSFDSVVVKYVVHTLLLLFYLAMIAWVERKIILSAIR